MKYVYFKKLNILNYDNTYVTKLHYYQLENVVITETYHNYNEGYRTIKN